MSHAAASIAPPQPQAAGSLFRTAARALRGVGSQVAVSVIATAAASALFSATWSPRPEAPAQADASKLQQRVSAGAVPLTTVRLGPHELATLASLSSFTPQASPAPQAPAPLPVARPKLLAVSVLPPPRPAMRPAPSALVAAPEGPAPVGARPLSIAGVAVPAALDMRRYAPSADAVMGAGAGAWRATAGLVGRVAKVGGLLGL